MGHPFILGTQASLRYLPFFSLVHVGVTAYDCSVPPHPQHADYPVFHDLLPLPGHFCQLGSPYLHQQQAQEVQGHHFQVYSTQYHHLSVHVHVCQRRYDTFLIVMTFA